MWLPNISIIIFLNMLFKMMQQFGTFSKLIPRLFLKVDPLRTTPPHALNPSPITNFSPQVSPIFGLSSGIAHVWVYPSVDHKAFSVWRKSLGDIRLMIEWPKCWALNTIVITLHATMRALNVLMVALSVCHRVCHKWQILIYWQRYTLDRSWSSELDTLMKGP